MTASFADYCANETLDGENKYFAEGFGLQDARKGVIFKEFPPVLHLQMKRFEYDMERDMLVKINDRHEFGLVIEVDSFLDTDADLSVPQRYHLHGVLVHSGDLNGGHYFSFIRPEKNGKWYKFDDDRVVPATEYEVMDENFGGGPVEQLPPGAPKSHMIKQWKRLTNAYMLVYIRESDIDEVLCPITDDDIPQHLRTTWQLERYISLQKIKDAEEGHLYCTVRYASDQQLSNHSGFDLASFDTVGEPNSASVIKVLKETTFKDLKISICEQLGVSAEEVTIWSVVKRQNKTLRVETDMGTSFDNLCIAN